MSKIVNCPLVSGAKIQQYAVMTAQDVDWATLRALADASWLHSYETLTDIYANHDDSNPPYPYQLSRGFVKFDLSGINSSLTPIAATLKSPGASNWHDLYGLKVGHTDVLEYTGADPWTVADFDEFGDLYGEGLLSDASPTPLDPADIVLTEVVAITNIIAAMAGGRIIMVLQNSSDYDNSPPVPTFPTTYEDQRINGPLSLDVECEGPPQVASVTQAYSGRDQELDVVISGELFTGVTVVSFGSGITVDSFNVDDDFTISAHLDVSAAATLGLRDVTLTHPTYGDGVLVDGFEVIVPLTTFVDPVTLCTGDYHDDVEVSGIGFMGVIDVSFGAGITVTNIFGVDDTKVLCDIVVDPAAAPGLRAVIVTNAVDVGSGDDMFEVLASPTLISMTPNIGAPGDNLIGIIIIGSGFLDLTWMGIDMGPLGWFGFQNIVVDSDIQITADFLIDLAAPIGVHDMELDTNCWVLKAGFFTVGAPIVDVAVAHKVSPYVTACPWYTGVGFGIKYANPSILPSGDSWGVAFCGSTDLAVVHAGSPYVSVYSWMPGMGFGVRYANPVTPPSAGSFSTGVAFCGSTDIAVSYDVTPFIYAYPWTPGVGFGIKYANPASLPVGMGRNVAFCGDTDVAIAHTTSPYVSAYPWLANRGATGIAFGDKYADPGTLPTGQGVGVAFCGSTDIAVAHVGAPYVSVYPWTPGAGFGAKYADPGTTPTGTGYAVAFCGSTDVAIGHNSDPFVTAYPWTPGVGFGIKYANPATKPTGGSQGVAFNGNADIAVTSWNSPQLIAYPWTPGIGFGIRYDGFALSDEALGVTFSAPANPSAPVLASVAPDAGHRLETLTVVLIGTELCYVTSVDFGADIIVGSVVADSQFQITVSITIAAGAAMGLRDVSVTTTYGTSILAAIFDVEDFADLVDVVFTHSGSPKITAYPWLSGAGFGGAKYADPVVIPAGSSANKSAFCGTDLAVAHNGSPYLSAYHWVPGTGFGSKYADPASIPVGGCTGVAFCGITDVAVSHNITPFVTAYPWTPGAGFGVKYADPATPFVGSYATGIAFCGNTDVAVSHNNTPYVAAYPWTPGVGFGAGYANPGVLPASISYAVAFCGATDVAVAHIGNPYVSAYPWTPGAGFGVKYADPATKPTSTGNDVHFCGNTDIAIAHSTSPYVSAYPWTPGVGFGVKYADPITPLGASSHGWSVGFCGATDIAIGTDTDLGAPISAYSWTPGVGFGIKYADPSSFPPGSVWGVAFSDPFLPDVPTLTLVTPDSGQRTKTYAVVMTGTYFCGTISVDFGADITVNSFVVDSLLQITASITIAVGAALGLRDVSVTTIYGSATLVNGYTVEKLKGSGGGLAAKMLVMFGR